ncbi:MAG TPA: prolyl oligopeptidase family serine peptidase [Longimicrobiales bacterium]|nr:prolyl oligopeptidase family serine peptidase [Longimicrobiales bacterium]
MPQAQPHRLCRRWALFALPLSLVSLPAAAQEQVLAQEGWARPPAAIEQAVLAPRYENATLTNRSPNGRFFLHQAAENLPSQADFAKESLWFGGLQIDPAANRARTFTTRGATALSVTEWETGRTIDIQVPRGARVTGARWSPEGDRVAYFANTDNATHIWVAELPSGRSRQVTRTPVLATLNTSFDWTTDGRGIVTVLVPQGRGAPPATPEVPTGPQVRLSSEGENRLRTYFDLMEWPHQFEQLEYYTTGQLAIVDVQSRTERRIGQPAMIRSVDVGPNGEYLRVSTMQKPFSYIVTVSMFGGKEELWSADGRVITTLSERPLNEGVRQTGDDGPGSGQQDGNMRNLQWHPAGLGLSYLEQEPAPAGGDSAAAGGARPAGQQASNRRRDRVMLWAPPFTDESKRVLYESDTRMNSVRYSADGELLVITEGSGNSAHTYAVFLSEPGTRHTLLRGGNNDFYNNPGSLMTTSGPLGYDVVRVSSDGSSVFLSGTQYFEDPHQQAPHQFVDRVNIRTGEKQRVYAGDNSGVSERIGAILDDDVTRLIVTRESPTQVPNSFLRDSNGTLRQLTSNRDLTPEVTNAQRQRYTVTRPDGVSFKVDVTVPAGHRAGNRLPALFWFYPREYTDQESYDRTLRTYDMNRYPSQGVRSMEIMTLAGYAVVQPDAPIIGETGRMNDNYVHDLRNNLLAVIDHLDREGIIDRQRLAAGGHSYGAFSTVNAMVHTPFFKAGIAGHGAYNRTLTPLGFQSERRDFWQAREVYLGMSPFVYANNLTGALLMYHGMHDHNVGTHPLNSIRLFHALNGLGKTASLYMYPFEDHGPATEETLLDLWARWVAWLDKYVKNDGREAPAVIQQ